MTPQPGRPLSSATSKRPELIAMNRSMMIATSQGISSGRTTPGAKRAATTIDAGLRAGATSRAVEGQLLAVLATVTDVKDAAGAIIATGTDGRALDGEGHVVTTLLHRLLGIGLRIAVLATNGVVGPIAPDTTIPGSAGTTITPVNLLTAITAVIAPGSVTAAGNMSALPSTDMVLEEDRTAGIMPAGMAGATGLILPAVTKPTSWPARSAVCGRKSRACT